MLNDKKIPCKVIIKITILLATFRGGFYVCFGCVNRFAPTYSDTRPILTDCVSV